MAELALMVGVGDVRIGTGAIMAEKAERISRRAEALTPMLARFAERMLDKGLQPEARAAIAAAEDARRIASDWREKGARFAREIAECPAIVPRPGSRAPGLVWFQAAKASALVTYAATWTGERLVPIAGFAKERLGTAVDPPLTAELAALCDDILIVEVEIGDAEETAEVLRALADHPLPLTSALVHAVREALVGGIARDLAVATEAEGEIGVGMKAAVLEGAAMGGAVSSQMHTLPPWVLRQFAGELRRVTRAVAGVLRKALAPKEGQRLGLEGVDDRLVVPALEPLPDRTRGRAGFLQLPE